LDFGFWIKRLEKSCGEAHSIGASGVNANIFVGASILDFGFWILD
jgi:hypothetical protein